MTESTFYKAAEEKLRLVKSLLSEYEGVPLTPKAQEYLDMLLDQVEKLAEEARKEGAPPAPWYDLGLSRGDLPEFRLIEGYCATWGVNESGFSFWRGSLRFDKYLGYPVICLDHSPARLVGQCLTLKEDERGLWCRVLIADKTPWADVTWTLIKAGLLDAFSVRIDLRTAKTNTVWQHPFVTHADLVEISVVTTPRDPGARFKVVPGPYHPGVTLEDLKAVRKLVTHFKRPPWWPPGDEPSARPWF